MASCTRLCACLVVVTLAVVSVRGAFDGAAIGKCPPGSEPCGDAGCADGTSIVCDNVTGECQYADTNTTALPPNALKLESAALSVACIPFANACGSTLCADNQLCSDDECQEASDLLPLMGNISDAQASDAAASFPDPSTGITAVDACTEALDSTPNCNSGDPTQPLTSADCVDLGFDSGMAALPNVECFSSGDFVCAAWNGSVVYACATMSTDPLGSNDDDDSDVPDDTLPLDELLPGMFMPGEDTNDTSLSDMLQPLINGSDSSLPCGKGVHGWPHGAMNVSDIEEAVSDIEEAMNEAFAAIANFTEQLLAPFSTNLTSKGNISAWINNVLHNPVMPNSGSGNKQPADSVAFNSTSEDIATDIHAWIEDMLHNLTDSSGMNFTEHLLGPLADITSGKGPANITDWINGLLSGLLAGNVSGGSEVDAPLDGANGSAGAVDGGGVPLPVGPGAAGVAGQDMSRAMPVSLAGSNIPGSGSPDTGSVVATPRDVTNSAATSAGNLLVASAAILLAVALL